MIFCVQCTMRAVMAGVTPPYFDQTIEEHMSEYHPDLEATAKERKHMEEVLRERMKESKND